MNQDDYCCLDGCCGPGSWCCGHARPHTHDDEPDAREALARVAEYLRQFDRLRDTGGVIHRVHTDPDVDEGADLTSADLRAIIAAGFGRHPEPVKPSRADVRDVIAGHPIGSGYYGTTVGIDEADEIADAVLALLPGRSESEVQVETLREAAKAANRDWLGFKSSWGSNPTDQAILAFALWAAEWLVARADRIERGES